MTKCIKDQYSQMCNIDSVQQADIFILQYTYITLCNATFEMCI